MKKKLLKCKDKKKKGKLNNEKFFLFINMRIFKDGYVNLMSLGKFGLVVWYKV